MEQAGSSLVVTVTNNSADEWKFPLSIPETPLHSQTTEGSDILEDDVKVCDICGDAGREEMLAICSRCSDGAEHTYCMQIMLDKVPEGDWQCEECQLKENAEKQKLDKTKTVTGTPKESSSKEKDCGGTLGPKLVHKPDGKADEVEADKVSKVTASSHLSAIGHTDSHEDSLKSLKLATDAIARVSGMVNPCKNSALSRENSSKSLDVGKLKQSNLVASSRSQSVNNSKEVAHSLSTVGLDSSRTQAKFQPPRGLLSRSATFNSLSSKAKVKQLLENALQNQKLARQPSSIVTRKERLTAKSLSVRTPSSCRSNTIESKAKMLSSYLSHAEDPRVLRQAKGKTLSERKSSFKLDHSVVSSPAAGTSMSLPNTDTKSVFRGDSTSSFNSAKNAHDPITLQCDGKLNPSNSTISFAYKGPEKVLVSDGCDKVKKQSSCSSSGFGIHIFRSKPNSVERKPYQVGRKEDAAASLCEAGELCASPDVVLQGGLLMSNESTRQDGEAKDPSAVNSSKLTICTASGIHVSALTASAACSGEISNKRSKWKDVVEAISRARHKEVRLPDQSDELFLSSTGLSGDMPSTDQLSSSPSSVRNLSSEGISDYQEALQGALSDSSRSTATINVKQHSVHLTETICAPGEENTNAISTNSDELNLRPDVMKMTTQASVIANVLRISAIPDHDYIWQGGFMLQRSGRLTDYFDGIRAHMSTCASPRVLEVVKKFPCKVELEEIPRLSSWPMQFQGKVTEDNIALYFFAKDLESYEKNYKRLLDNMVKNDLVLKGHVDRIELLIFPSNRLPEKAQHWNGLFFLWAVFRERRMTFLESISHSKKLYRDTLDLGPSIQGPVAAEVITTQKTGSFGQKDKEFSMYESSPKAPEAVKSNTVDLPFLSFFQNGDKNCYKEALPLDQTLINLHEHNQSAIDDTHSSEKQALCSNFEIHSSTSAIQLTRVHDACSLSTIPVTNPELFPEVERYSTSLKEVYKDSRSKKEIQLQPCVQPTVQNSLNKDKLVTLDPDNSHCGQAGLTSNAANGQDTSSFSCKILPVSSSSLPEEADSGERLRLKDNVTLLEAERWKEHIGKQSCWELSSSRKHRRSNTPDAISETSSVISKETIPTMVWKEKSCLQVDGGSSCKKIKSCNDVNVRSSSNEQNIENGCFRKLLGLDLNSLNKEQEGVYAYGDTGILENSRTTERHLFPVDSVNVRDLKSGNSIPWKILSSDDENLPVTDVPNLELALGAEKKPSNQGSLPLFGQLRGVNNNPNKLLDDAKSNVDNDLSASLSLSLSFPFSEKEQPKKFVSKTEHLLPKRHHVNTSLLLFGGSTDT